MRVLFLCDGNACRSQLAAAYAQKKYAIHQFFSAGISPCKEIHWKTRAIAWEFGLELSDTPKHWSAFSGESFDLVISFSKKAADSVPWNAIFVSVDDPMPEGNRDQFLRTYLEVTKTVDLYLGQIV